jgi:hypothetical protein
MELLDLLIASCWISEFATPHIFATDQVIISPEMGNTVERKVSLRALVALGEHPRQKLIRAGLPG